MRQSDVDYVAVEIVENILCVLKLTTETQDQYDDLVLLVIDELKPWTE